MVRKQTFLIFRWEYYFGQVIVEKHEKNVTNVTNFQENKFLYSFYPNNYIS